jgi:hypothetical protein
MGKTLKYKKRRKNTRRYKQKRRKTTRKSKRKYQRTKKQKGGLCCKYENDWKQKNKEGDIAGDRLDGDGCNKGFQWKTSTEANVPPFLLPFWGRHPINNKNSQYYGNKFGLLKYTPVEREEEEEEKGSTQNVFFDSIKNEAGTNKINIGLFYHSLKHMEALGIKCYNIEKFTELLMHLIEKGQWWYTRKEPKKSADAPQLKTGVVYLNPSKHQPCKNIFTDFDKFFKSVTYKNTFPVKLQNVYGVRTCNCTYVLKTPIEVTKEKSTMLENSSEGEANRQPIAYTIAAVNLIFGKFVEKRLDSRDTESSIGETKHEEKVTPEEKVLKEEIVRLNVLTSKFGPYKTLTNEEKHRKNAINFYLKWYKRLLKEQQSKYKGEQKKSIIKGGNGKKKKSSVMVKSKISEQNKNALFLLAIQPYDIKEFRKFCTSKNDPMKATKKEEVKYHTLNSNNTSDCIGNIGDDWYLTRNNAAGSRNQGQIEPMPLLKSLDISLENKAKMAEEQIKLLKKIKQNNNNKLDIEAALAATADEYTKGISVSAAGKGRRHKLNFENPDFYNTFIKILNLDKSNAIALAAEFVELAKKFNFELNSFTNWVMKGIKEQLKIVGKKQTTKPPSLLTTRSTEEHPRTKADREYETSKGTSLVRTLPRHHMKAGILKRDSMHEFLDELDILDAKKEKEKEFADKKKSVWAKQMPAAAKKTGALLRLAKVLQDKYIDFYVKRQSCMTNGESKLRETVDNDLFDEILKSEVYDNFIEVGIDCNIKFKPPVQKEKLVKNIGETKNGGNKKTRKRKRRKRKHKRTRKR